MRKFTVFMVAAVLLSIGATGVSAAEADLQATPVQAAAPRADSGWTAGKVVAVGLGAVAGVMVANATLPMAWGMVTPIIGAVAGGMVGSWAHARATEPSPMIRQRASLSVEAPSLFQLASIPAQ